MVSGGDDGDGNYEFMMMVIMMVVVVIMYTVSTKKSNPCIHCHNSDKLCQILTEFWTNNAMSNCKQSTKFK